MMLKREVHEYQVDLHLPHTLDNSDSGQLIPKDIWLSKVFSKQKYPSFGKIVKSMLSSFHGPQDEGTCFDCVTYKESVKMNIEAYSSI